MQAWAGWGVGLALGTRANGSGVREPRDSLKSPMCSRTGNRTVQYPIWTVTRRVTYSVHCGHPLCPENWGSEDRTEIITHMSVVTTHICGETYGLKLYYKLGRSPRTHSHTHTHTHTLATWTSPPPRTRWRASSGSQLPARQVTLIRHTRTEPNSVEPISITENTERATRHTHPQAHQASRNHRHQATPATSFRALPSPTNKTPASQGIMCAASVSTRVENQSVSTHLRSPLKQRCKRERERERGEGAETPPHTPPGGLRRRRAPSACAWPQLGPRRAPPDRRPRPSPGATAAPRRPSRSWTP